MKRSGFLPWQLRMLQGLLTIGMVSFTPAHAAIDITMGSWYGTNGLDGSLRGRDINGNPINLLNPTDLSPHPDLAFIYDVDKKLTWLADWNLAGTSGYTKGTDGPDGLMIWGAPTDPADTISTGWNGGSFKTAHSWIAALNSGDGFGGFTDWVLPSAMNFDGSGPCFGLNCVNASMGHAWYISLGNSVSWTNTGPFKNVQFSAYWTSTPMPSNPAQPFAHYFLSSGFQAATIQGLPFYVVAMRSGDVLAVSPIPEPSSYILLLMGLCILVARLRSRGGVKHNI